MIHLSTHVLDTSRGAPAAGVTISLEKVGLDGTWSELARGVTDSDGRIGSLAAGVSAGEYRLKFATGAYFRGIGVSEFYPEVVVHVRLDGVAARYHLPLLLSPFGYSTYRGS